MSYESTEVSFGEHEAYNFASLTSKQLSIIWTIFSED